MEQTQLKLSCTSLSIFSIIGVAITPGAIAITRIPYLLNSRAVGKVNDTTPPLEAL